MNTLLNNRKKVQPKPGQKDQMNVDPPKKADKKKPVQQVQ